MAEEESYKDPANIQSKHQKHQAFESELAANSDRIKAVLLMGQNLIERAKCAGSEDAVQHRIESITKQWETLTQKTVEKSMKLKEANRYVVHTLSCILVLVRSLPPYCKTFFFV